MWDKTMTKKVFNRKLAAILSADVVGYSRLMGENEINTIQTLTAYKEAMTAIINQNQGRVVDAPGDNLLAEFTSVVNAVQCSVEIQCELAKRNEELPEEREMVFRIGVNLGDVVAENDRIYGDGVNIAARIESLCEGGGVCISRAAYDQVKDKLPYEYSYEGEQIGKNIKEPLRVYKVVIDSDAKTLETTGSKSLAFPDKPSIAVLPFVNMTGDPAQEYISDGITESIITNLSKIGELFVIARSSVYIYKAKPAKIQQVSRELGVRYILEGSVLKADNQLRITAKLVDATRGTNLWVEQLNRTADNFFALLDDISQKIAVELQVQLTRGEMTRIQLGTKNFDAWSHYIRGVSLFERYTKENNTKARGLFEIAVKKDHNYTMARVMLAWTYFVDAQSGFSDEPEQSIKQAIEYGKKVKETNESLPAIHSFWNTIYLFQKQYGKAVKEGKRAIELGPNDSLSFAFLARTMLYSGNFSEAVAYGKQAIRLSPYCPVWFLIHLGQAYLEERNYQDALLTLDRALDRSQKGEIPVIWSYPPIIVTCIRFDRENKAREFAAELLKKDPNLSVEQIGRLHPYKDPILLKRYLDDLRKAGLN
jgi:adenylate cyclase